MHLLHVALAGLVSALAANGASTDERLALFHDALEAPGPTAAGNDRAELLVELSSFLTELGRTEEALVAAQDATEFDPTDPEIRGVVARAFEVYDSQPIPQHNVSGAHIFEDRPLGNYTPTLPALEEGDPEQRVGNPQFRRLSNHPVTITRIDELLFAHEAAELEELRQHNAAAMDEAEGLWCFETREHLQTILFASGTGITFTDDDVLIDRSPTSEKGSRFCLNHGRSTELSLSLNYSLVTNFHKGHKEPLIDHLSERVSNLTGLADVHGGGWMLTAYHPGGRYTAHHDCDIRPGTKGRLDRIATVLVYLTGGSDVAGGETSFPQLPALDNASQPLKVTPVAGRALVWRNYGTDDECVQESMHAALAVQQGVKAIAQQWFYRTASPGIAFAPPAPAYAEYSPGTPIVRCDAPGKCRKYNTWTHY